MLRKLFLVALASLGGATLASAQHVVVRGVVEDVGNTFVLDNTPVTLSGKSLMAKAAQAYEAFRKDGKLPATFEVVYGHAWKPQPRLGPTGRPVIDIKPQRTWA